MSMRELETIIKKQLEKAEKALALCEKWLEQTEKEFSQKSFPDDRKRIHDLTQDFDLWKIMRDLAQERVDALKAVEACFNKHKQKLQDAREKGTPSALCITCPLLQEILSVDEKGDRKE